MPPSFATVAPPSTAPWDAATAFLDQRDKAIARNAATQQAEEVSALRQLQTEGVRRSFADRLATEAAVRAATAVPEEEIARAPGVRAFTAPAPLEASGAEAGALVEAGQAPEPMVGSDLPAITARGRSFAGMNRALGPDKMTRLLTTPEGQAAMKGLGVMSDDEVRYRQGVAEAEQEARRLHGEFTAAMKAGDAIGLALKQAAYYERLATIFAQSKPEQAQQARRLSEQLMMQATALQKDQQEQGLANQESGILGERLAKFNAPGGQTAENYASVLMTPRKSKFVQTLYGNMVTTSFKAGVEKMQQGPTREFYRHVVEDLARQRAVGGGTLDLDEIGAHLAAAKAVPGGFDILAGLLLNKGADGELARKAFDGKNTKLSDWEVAAKAAEQIDRVTARDPGYLAAVIKWHNKIKNNPAATARQLATLDRNRWLDARRILKDKKDDLGRELAEVNRDLRAIDPARRKFGPGKVQAEDLAKKKAYLEGQISKIQTEIEGLKKPSYEVEPPPTVSEGQLRETASGIINTDPEFDAYKGQAFARLPEPIQKKVWEKAKRHFGVP